MKLRTVQDDILIEIRVLSRKIQEKERTYYNGRIIEYLSCIAGGDDYSKAYFLAWLDTNEEREYYEKIIN